MAGAQTSTALGYVWLRPCVSLETDSDPNFWASSSLHAHSLPGKGLSTLACHHNFVRSLRVASCQRCLHASA